MVQVIEQEGLGDILGRSIGGGFGSAFSSGLEMLAKDRLEQMKQKRLLDVLEGFKQKRTQLQGSELSPEELVTMEKIAPGSAKIYQEAQKREQSKKSEAQDKERVQSAVNEMMQTLEYTGPLKLLEYGKEEVREQRQYFDSLAMNLEEIAATMVGKGVLSKPRFEFLLKNLPSSRKSQAQNKGALKAWSKTLGLEFPGSKNEEETEEVKFKLEKVEPGTPLTKEVVEEFRRRGLSIEDAKKTARKLGYEF